VRKNALEIYALTVCFISLFCGVIAFGFAAFDLARIVSPTFTVDRDVFNRYQSNDAWSTVADPWYLRQTTAGHVPSEKELSARRMSEFARAIADESHKGKVGLFRRLINILVAVAVFAGHWRIGRAARASPNNSFKPKPLRGSA
jgi:hypothetical protein